MQVSRRSRRAATVTALLATMVLATGLPAASEDRRPVAVPEVEGPLPGAVPGNPGAADIEDTYPFFSTDIDLAAAGFVEEEFLVRGAADAYGPDGSLLNEGEGVPYETRIIVRRPAEPKRFNGTALVEWQNVTAGYDLDALWNHRHILDQGYAWVGVSAQRVGVDALREWSPARYGSLDVTGDRAFLGDQLSYDIFAQAAKGLTDAEGDVPLGDLDVETVLAIGASQSAGRMTIYYDAILPKVDSPFDGYGFIVGNAPTRVGSAPIFHVLSETDVVFFSGATARSDSDTYRRWEVAGTAHSGWDGQEYRRDISDRDLGSAPEYDCTAPPFSRVPMHQVTGAAYDHLAAWAQDGTAPPTAEPIARTGLVIHRDELGLAEGGIRLSQVEVPTALNTGFNSGASFCFLFGTHQPFDQDTLDELYRNRGQYVSAVRRVDRTNVQRGYITHESAQDNHRDALDSDIGR